MTARPAEPEPAAAGLWELASNPCDPGHRLRGERGQRPPLPVPAPDRLRTSVGTPHGAIPPASSLWPLLFMKSGGQAPEVISESELEEVTPWGLSAKSH